MLCLEWLIPPSPPLAMLCCPKHNPCTYIKLNNHKINFGKYYFLYFAGVWIAQLQNAYNI